MAELVKVDQPAGINLIKEEVQLDPRKWQDSDEIQFKHGVTKKVKGYEEGLGTALVRPHIIQPLRDDDNTYYWWAYAGFDDLGDGRMYQVQTSQSHLDVTPVDGVMVPSGPIIGIDYSWTGDSINGVPYLSYGVPYAFSSDTGKFKMLSNIPRHDLIDGDPGWDPEYPENNWNKGAPRVRFQAIRTYQNFLIGLNYDCDDFIGNIENGYGPQDPAANQNAVWWSHSVVGKEIDVGWKDSAANQFSGWNFLGGAGGSIVDGKALRDGFIIYRESSVWQMTYIGGVSIFAFKEIFNDAGVLGVDCAAEVDGKHFVIGQSDVYMHDGVKKQSIADGVVRVDLFSRIDPMFTKNVFMATNYSEKEIMICIPESGRIFRDESERATYEGTCNLAYIYNWEEKTWAKRSLPNVTSSAYTILSVNTGDPIHWISDEEGGWIEPDGPAEFPDAPGVTWEEATDDWGDSYYSYNPSEWGLVMTSADNAIYTLYDKNLQNGENFTAQVEKTHLDCGDRLVTKYVSRILPQVRFGSVDVYVSGSMGLEEGFAYEYIGRFDPSKDTHIACRKNGRYIHVKFVIPKTSRAEIRGWTLEYTVIGRR